MNKEYIYEAPQNKRFTNAKKAIIILPDIFGQTDYAKATSSDLADHFELPVYLLDYFYQLTKESTNIEQSNSEIAAGLMQSMSGDDFIAIFEQSILDISSQHKDIVEIFVIGFCFAGRLAYLTGENHLVSTIISFYGAGANIIEFIDKKSAIEYLVAKRGTDSSLSVCSFFGTEDESIPRTERESIKAQLLDTKIDYNDYEYEAQHAYFQPGRANYNDKAAKASWQELDKII